MNGRRWPRLERLYVAGETRTIRLGARYRLIELGYDEDDLTELARNRIRALIQGDEGVDDLTPQTAKEPTKEEIRAELARRIVSINAIEQMLREEREKAQALEVKLLNDPTVRMASSEGVVTPYGVLKRYVERKGRAFPNQEEIDKHAGELPEELRPVKDHRVVIERLSKEDQATQAYILGLAQRPAPEGEAPNVVATEKVAYPTVSKLRAEFGEDTALVGKPPAVHRVVLEVEGVDAEHPILLTTDGAA